MNGWELLDALGRIDDEYIREAAGAPAGKTRRYRRTAAACAAAVAAAAVFFALQNIPRTAPGPVPGEEGGTAYEAPSGGETTSTAGERVSGQPTSAASAGETPPTDKTPLSPVTEPSREAQEPSQAGTAEETSLVPEGGLSGAQTGGEEIAVGTKTAPEGGSFGGPSVPEHWSSDAPVARGTGYTRQELDALLERDGGHIAQSVAAETGCAPEDVRVCREGWCHTSLGEENYYDADYLTLPVCAGDTVVASVDLFRVDGQPHYSLSAGGPRWENLNRALRSGEVAFAYAGFGEVAVAADGAVFPITVGAEEAVAGIGDLYGRVAAPQTVFSFARLQAALSEARQPS